MSSRGYAHSRDKLRPFEQLRRRVAADTNEALGLWMRANVPGVHIPDAVVKRLEGAANQRAEGKAVCIEIIQRVRAIAGVAGVHVMAYRQEELVSEIIQASGVLQGRARAAKQRNMP